MRILEDESDADIEAANSREEADDDETVVKVDEESSSTSASTAAGWFWKWQFYPIGAILFLLLIFYIQPEEHHVTETVKWESSPFNTTRTLFITMNPSDQEVLEQIHVLRSQVGFDNVEVFAAVDGKTVDMDSLPLYTRYLMENGRHDHHQVSTTGMVGCYLSHVRALEMMKPGDVFAVFEEDAHFAANGPSKLKQLHNFIERTALSYDIIMIGINRIPSPSGETTNLPVSDGLDLVACHKDCAVWGTRGYIITYDGAQKMLKHAYPIQTQIDALLSLVARYDNSFKLFWTSQDIALGPALLAIVADINYSKVQDHCLKCHLPNANIFYLSAIPGFLVLVGLYVAVHCRSHPRVVTAAEISIVGGKNVALGGKNVALMGSPRSDDNSSNAPAGSISKLDDRHDQVQVQVQPASVPQGLATGFGGGHRRTGSRESETTMHRRTGSRDCETAAAAAMGFSIHRRAGSRDVLDAGSIASVSESSLGWSVDAVNVAAGTGGSTC